MKSSHAWVACSLVSAGFVFVACGSDDGKKTKPEATGGAGGEAGEPAAAAGHSGAPPQPPEGGAGGTPMVTPGGAGMSGAGAGAGGEGGQVTPPLCFDLVDQNVGGAGAGGAAPDALPPQPKFRFRCDDLTLGYVVDDAQNAIAFTLALKQGPGLLPATVGRFTFDYSYYDGAQYQNFCTEQTTAIESKDGILRLPFDTTDITDDLRFHIRTMAVTDECGNELPLDTSGESGFCWSPVLTANRGSWFIDCYEGNGNDCEATCPVP
jgi:hypothetical protein